MLSFNSLLLYIANIWLVIEVLFYVFFRWRLNRLQRLTPPVRISTKQRAKLFDHIIEYLTPATAQTFLQGWFFGAPFESIHVQNVEDWVSWAMFSLRTEDMNRTERAELDIIVGRMEDKVGKKFPSGKNHAIKCARLTLDPVRAVHRPLFIYAFMKSMWILSGVLLRSKGFRRYHSGQLTYWHRPQSGVSSITATTSTSSSSPRAAIAPPGGAIDDKTSNDDASRNAPPMSPVSASVAADPHPLVFIHGIGIGLIAYHWFLLGCWPSRTTFIVELPHISMQLVTADMTIEETVDAIDHMLRAHQVEQACFMGHSFGSICVAWMIKHRPEMVSSTILLDPVCFLLFMPDICQNFVYTEPSLSGSSLMQWFIFYFARRELNISHALSRQFWWYRNVLLPHELPARTTVLLSGRDEISPSRLVLEYLTRHNQMVDATQRDVQAKMGQASDVVDGGITAAIKGAASGSKVNILWYPNLIHAGFLLANRAQQHIYSQLH